MIAPVREPLARSSAPPNSLALARRAVAAVLLKGTARPARGVPRVSNLLAWAFVVWAVAVAIAYLAFGGWWKIPWY